jgi:hypothetical protein
MSSPYSRTRVWSWSETTYLLGLFGARSADLVALMQANLTDWVVTGEEHPGSRHRRTGSAMHACNGVH